MSELWRLSGAETARRVRDGLVSAREVADAALARLDAVNPAINAVIDPLPDSARAEAEAVDAARAAGDALGPLAGAPVTIKINVDCAGRANTNGLRIQSDLIAERDSPVVANLRRAGALVIGRTATPAFSLRWFTRSAAHGATRNPMNPALTPGGSSGGAAAAVAAGIGAIGHGTDIAGSIRYPAYACGLHGLRPSFGRVPAVNFTSPDRHIGAQIMAVSGPIARTVEDLRLGLEAMSSRDVRDPWWVPAPLVGPETPKRVALCLDPDGLEPAPEVEEAVRGAAARLVEAGWEVVKAETPPMREPARLQLLLWLAEYRRTGGEALAREGDPDALFVYEQLSAAAPEPDLNAMLDALQTRARLVREWSLFLDEHPVLLCPVSMEPPFADHEDVSSPEAFARILEAQTPQVGLPFMGMPAMSVATGMAGDRPMGVQLVSGRFREDLILAAAADIEARGTPPSPVDPVPG